jgi:hypothetical protein
MNQAGQFTYTRRSRFRSSPVLVLGIGAAVATLFVLLVGVGAVDLSKLGSNKRSTAGLVPVPLAARTIRAYTKVTQSDLFDPKTGDLAVIYLKPEAIAPTVLTRVPDILGRVLNHEKAAGYDFTDTDFFPRGTREGIVAGIPAGKRAIRVDATKVEGLYGLHVGDRFDLISTLAIDSGRGAQQTFNFGGVYGQQLALQARMTNWQKQATVRVLAQNGVLVEPMTTRQIPVFSNTFTQGGITRMRPLQEVVIAVAPEEVVRVEEAIAVEAKISCVPRSGQPGDPPNSVTPDLQPVSPFTGPGVGAVSTSAAEPAAVQSAPFATVETIQGTRRELAAVPQKR